jgi:hypothetical protein
MTYIPEVPSSSLDRLSERTSCVGFEVLKGVNTKMAASIITLMMEAARNSETLVNFYQTIWRYNPEEAIYCTIDYHEFS